MITSADTHAPRVMSAWMRELRAGASRRRFLAAVLVLLLLTGSACSARVEREPDGVQVFIGDGASAADVEALTALLESQAGVESVVYTSAVEQFEAWNEALDSAEEISTLTEDSFPAMIDVEFDGRGADDVDTLIEALEAWPRYDAVVDSIERVPAE